MRHFSDAMMHTAPVVVHAIVIGVIISFFVNCMRIGEAATLEKKVKFDRLRCFKFCHLRGI